MYCSSFHFEFHKEHCPKQLVDFGLKTKNIMVMVWSSMVICPQSSYISQNFILKLSFLRIIFVIICIEINGTRPFSIE